MPAPRKVMNESAREGAGSAADDAPTAPSNSDAAHHPRGVGRNAFGGSAVGDFTYRTIGERWEWSDAVFEMHGYRPHEVELTTALIESHEHCGDGGGIAARLARHQDYCLPFSIRRRIVDTAGRIHVVVIVADRPVDDSGAVAGARGCYVDITDGYEDDLQRTLDVILEDITRTRGVISQAIGMVRLVHDVSEERAFEVLKWLSSQTNTKLRDIAAQLVTDAEGRSIVPAVAKKDFDRLLLSTPRRIGCRR